MIRIFLVLSFLFWGKAFSDDTVYIPDSDQGVVIASEQPMEDPMQDLFGAGYASSFKRMMLSLFALVALSIISVWLFRRILRNRHKGNHDMSHIHILEKKVLSPKTMLYLVEIDKEKVLLSESHLEVRPLHTKKLSSTLSEVSQHAISREAGNTKRK